MHDVIRYSDEDIYAMPKNELLAQYKTLLNEARFGRESDVLRRTEFEILRRMVV